MNAPEFPSPLQIRWTSPLKRTTDVSPINTADDLHLDNLTEGTTADRFDIAKGLPLGAFDSTANLLRGTPYGIREMLLTQGVPEVLDADGKPVNPVKEAIHLLKMAAEVEHALMVQYLYAYASVQEETPLDVEVKETIRRVAIQEMGHLLSVQNLLLSIGGPDAFHFGRDALRVGSVYNALPLALERLSLGSLATYVVAEMPAHVTPEQQATVDTAIELVTLQGINYHRVGTLYAKLSWLFQPDDMPRAPYSLEPTPDLLVAGQHITPGDFVPISTIDEFAATTAEKWVQGGVSHFILEKATNNDTALTLLNAIAEQGEGPLKSEKGESHFEDFLTLFTTLLNDAQAINIAPLPRSPVASTPIAPDAGQSTPITMPYLKGWADLFDLRYNILLVDLWHTMTTPVASRSDLITTFYKSMYAVNTLSKWLLKIGVRLNVADVGPPYALMYDYMTNPWVSHQSLLNEQAALIALLEADPLIKANEKAVLQNIKNLT